MDLESEIIEEVKSAIDKNILKKYLNDAFLDFASNISKAKVEIIFISSSKIQELNKTYRNKNEPTDVLSFPTYINEMGDKVLPNQELPNLGTIFICPKVVTAQVGTFGKTYKEELLELAVHGLRHLLGHDHDDQGNWLNY